MAFTSPSSTHTPTPIIVKVHWSVRGLFGIAMVFYASVAALSGLRGNISLAVFFLFMAALGGLMLTLAGSSLEVDEEAITVKTLHGRYQISLSEVVLIEANYQGSDLVFHGDNKRLSISFRLTGEGTRECYEFLNAQIHQRQLAVKRSHRVPLTSKNVKIRK